MMKRISSSNIRKFIPSSGIIQFFLLCLSIYLMHCCYIDGYQNGYNKGLSESMVQRESRMITYEANHAKHITDILK